MSKHFRNLHKGLEVLVTTHRDAEMDRRVEEILADYAVPLWETTDPDLLAWSLPTTGTGSGSGSGSGVTRQSQRTHNGTNRMNGVRRDVTKPVSTVDEDGVNEDVSPIVHQCPLCPYTSNSLKLLHGHKVMHAKCRLKCPYCQFCGPFLSRIRRHWKRVHQKDGLPFEIENIGNGDNDEVASTRSAPETVTMTVKATRTTRLQDIRDAFRAVATNTSAKGSASIIFFI